MAKTLILTPNKNETCGMYQLAKDLAEEFNGDIATKKGEGNIVNNYDQVITLLYPMHPLGWKSKKMLGKKWICYDQKVPPATKKYFPNFFRRQYMKWFSSVNKKSMQGADEYWDVTEREQKPRYKGRLIDPGSVSEEQESYATYIGRRIDYKNFDRLEKIMEELNIPFRPSKPNSTDKDIHVLLSNAKLLVTASLWEGYGRTVMEAQALDIPVVCYDVGAHNKLVHKGKVFPVGEEENFKKAIVDIYNYKE